MLLPPSHRPREGLETLRQVAPHLAEFATAISDALDEKVAYDPPLSRQRSFGCAATCTKIRTPAGFLCWTN